MRFAGVVLLVLMLIFCCSDKNQSSIDISKVIVDFSVMRFEIDFYSATQKTLPKVKLKYPYLFPEAFSDSISFSKIGDAQEQKLFSETQKVFKDFSETESQLTSLFKHIKYYNPTFQAPNVVTLQTNIDYDSKVIYADSLLFISLDVYLGKDHEFYDDFPKYIKENNTKEHLIVDVGEAISGTQIPLSNNRTFIGKMIHEGKKIALLDWYLPAVSEKEKMGYAQEKLDWAVENEGQIWAFFIEEQLLFSTETNLNKRFLENAPFSKFYKEQDGLSPGKIGVWIGWKIVQSYLKHNKVSLQEFLKLDETIIFNNSKYKPKK